MWTQVARGTHRIDSRLGERLLSQWLFTGSESALLLDTGVAGTVTEHIVPASNEEFGRLAADARLLSHALDRAQIESFELIARQRYGWYRRHGLDYDDATWRWLANAAGSDTPLDGEIAAGEVIDLGGLTLEVLHLPGHSLGHIGLFDPASRTAIVADAVMGRGFVTLQGTRAGPPPYLDLPAYRATIAQLQELAARA